MSLIKKIQLISGDSSDIHLFSSPDFTDFSSADWEGKAVIRSTDISGEVVTEIGLTKSDGTDGDPVASKFIFQITPTSSALLEAGTYMLAIEIRNLALNFRKEIVQAVLIILPSGVPNDYV